MRVKLKDVCTFYTGTGFPKKYQGQLSGTYPFYKVGDIANNVVSGKVYLEQCNNYISEETLELIKGSIVPKNTVVFAKIGEALKLNRRAITSTDCLIDNNAMGIAAKSDKLKTLFFYYFMRNIKMELLAESTTVPSVRKSRLEAYEIDIPSLDEQEIIERKLTILSKMINLKEKQLLKLDELVKARFVEMFGDPNIEFKYNSIKFNDLVVRMTKGPFGSDMKKDLFVPKGEDTYKVYIQINAIQKNQSLGEYYISKEYFDRKVSRFELFPNDYIITCDGTLGKYLKLDENMEKGVISPSLLRLTLQSDRINDKYFENIWDFYMLGLMKKEARNACLVHLPSAKKIGEISIPLPPLELQNQFASFVEEIDKSRSRIQKSLEASQELFDSLMQEYFG